MEVDFFKSIHYLIQFLYGTPVCVFKRAQYLMWQGNDFVNVELFWKSWSWGKVFRNGEDIVSETKIWSQIHKQVAMNKEIKTYQHNKMPARAFGRAQVTQ